MSRRVLVAPAPLREIEHTYGPILRGAGYTIEYPPRDNFLTEQQMKHLVSLLLDPASPVNR